MLKKWLLIIRPVWLFYGKLCVFIKVNYYVKILWFSLVDFFVFVIYCNDYEKKVVICKIYLTIITSLWHKSLINLKICNYDCKRTP